MRTTLLFLALFFVCAFGAQVDRIIIDDFNTGDNLIVIQLTQAQSPIVAGSPVNQTSFYVSTDGVKDIHILGGERDLQYSAQTGTEGRVFSTSVSVVDGSGEWEISTPNGGSGVVLMQYDALDNSLSLNVKGFTQITGTTSGIDITENGLGDSFHAVVSTDLATTYFINVYSPDGTKCSAHFDVGNDTTNFDFVVKFNTFTGSCKFTNVGAIELSVQALENVDTIVGQFTTQGLANPTTATATATVSKSKSISKTPSVSKSGSKGASISKSPSQSKAGASPSSSTSPSQGASASPAAAGDCFCQCPAFTCELIFDVDDDNNHALFFVDDDGFNGNPGYGGYGYYYANGAGQSGSASTLVASVATILAAFLGFF